MVLAPRRIDVADPEFNRGVVVCVGRAHNAQERIADRNLERLGQVFPRAARAQVLDDSHHGNAEAFLIEAIDRGAPRGKRIGACHTT